MKKFILIGIMVASAFADIQNISSDASNIKGIKVKIIDIRTPGEWTQTGIVPNSIPIMFFNENGGYNIDKFLQELKLKLNGDKKFAIICRTGSRTRTIAPFLSKQGYNIINLSGGIKNYIRTNGKIAIYK